MQNICMTMLHTDIKCLYIFPTTRPLSTTRYTMRCFIRATAICSNAVSHLLKDGMLLFNEESSLSVSSKVVLTVGDLSSLTLPSNSQ